LSTLFVRQNFDPDEWISQAEAARIRRVSRQAIARLIQKGRFKPLKIGGRFFLKRTEVENYRAEHPGRPKNERKNRKR
jgi:excisionase family DNA binding protein